MMLVRSMMGPVTPCNPPLLSFIYFFNSSSSLLMTFCGKKTLCCFFVSCLLFHVCSRWMRTLQQQIIGCSTGALAAGGASMRMPTLVETVSSWFSIWTLTRIICSGSVLEGRAALSGARGVSHRPDTPRSHRTVGGEKMNAI